MRCFLILIIMLSLFSCHQVQRESQTLLPPDKMESVLWDYIRADVYSVEFFKKYHLSENDTLFNLKMQKSIFEYHKVSPSQFLFSYHYYCLHPEKMSVILDSIEARQNREKRILELDFNKERI